MNEYEIRNLRIEIRSRANSLAVYEPKLTKMEREIETQQEKISSLQVEDRANLDSIMKLLKRMGKEGELYLQSIAPDILAEVKNHKSKEVDGMHSSTTTDEENQGSDESDISGAKSYPSYSMPP